MQYFATLVTNPRMDKLVFLASTFARSLWQLEPFMTSPIESPAQNVRGIVYVYIFLNAHSLHSMLRTSLNGAGSCVVLLLLQQMLLVAVFQLPISLPLQCTSPHCSIWQNKAGTQCMHTGACQCVTNSTEFGPHNTTAYCIWSKLK